MGIMNVTVGARSGIATKHYWGGLRKKGCFEDVIYRKKQYVASPHLEENYTTHK